MGQLSESSEMRSVYHGADVQKSTLPIGTFVTKRFRDACKFGYRRAVLNGASHVFIYEILVEDENLT